jgi:hypothetical protein
VDARSHGAGLLTIWAGSGISVVGGRPCAAVRTGPRCRRVLVVVGSKGQTSFFLPMRGDSDPISLRRSACRRSPDRRGTGDHGLGDHDLGVDHRQGACLARRVAELRPSSSHGLSDELAPQQPRPTFWQPQVRKVAPAACAREAARRGRRVGAQAWLTVARVDGGLGAERRRLQGLQSSAELRLRGRVRLCALFRPAHPPGLAPCPRGQVRGNGSGGRWPRIRARRSPAAA